MAIRLSGCFLYVLRHQELALDPEMIEFSQRYNWMNMHGPSLQLAVLFGLPILWLLAGHDCCQDELSRS